MRSAPASGAPPQAPPPFRRDPRRLTCKKQPSVLRRPASRRTIQKPRFPPRHALRQRSFRTCTRSPTARRTPPFSFAPPRQPCSHLALHARPASPCKGTYPPSRRHRPALRKGPRPPHIPNAKSPGFPAGALPARQSAAFCFIHPFWGFVSGLHRLRARRAALPPSSIWHIHRRRSFAQRQSQMALYRPHRHTSRRRCSPHASGPPALPQVCPSRFLPSRRAEPARRHAMSP